jgi:hypothetical protein
MCITIIFRPAIFIFFLIFGEQSQNDLVAFMMGLLVVGGRCVVEVG